jgi:3-mercaptopyruvate sulfurtransferase SseA
VIVYDNSDKGFFSSPRVWWMFRVSTWRLTVEQHCVVDSILEGRWREREREREREEGGRIFVV